MSLELPTTSRPTPFSSLCRQEPLGVFRGYPTPFSSGRSHLMSLDDTQVP